MEFVKYYISSSSYFPNEPDIINFIMTNRFEEALELCSYMIESRGSFDNSAYRKRHKGYVHRANCYKKMKEYNKAIDDYTKAIELIKDEYSYDYEEFYHLRALCYQEMKQYDNAIKDHSEAIKRNRRHKWVYPDIYFKYRADCYKEMGEYKKADIDYERAIKNYTKELDNWAVNKCYYQYATRSEEKLLALRADCYKSMGKTAKAIEDYTKLIEGNKAAHIERDKYINVVINYYSSRGDCYKDIKQYGEAIKDYTSAIKLNPGRNEDYIKRADCYVGLESYNSAIADYTKAIEIYPYEWKYYYNRAKCFFKLGKFNKMRDDYNYLISNPENKLYDVDTKKCEFLNEKLRLISTKPVEIKTCTKQEIMSIEGISSSIADKFIKLRDNGAMWYNIETFVRDFNIESHNIISIQNRLVFPLKQGAKIGRKLDF